MLTSSSSGGGVRNRSTRSPSNDRKSSSSSPPPPTGGIIGLGGHNNDHRGKLHHGGGQQRRRLLRSNKALLVFACAFCAFALCLLGMRATSSYSATMGRGGYVRQMADAVDAAKSRTQSRPQSRGIRRRRRRPGGEEEELFPVIPDNDAGEEADAPPREEGSSPPPDASRNRPRNGDAAKPKRGGGKDWKDLIKGQQRGKTHHDDKDNRPPRRREKGGGGEEEQRQVHRVREVSEQRAGKDPLERRRFITKPMMVSPTLIDNGDNRQRRSKKKNEMASPAGDDDDEVEESAEDDTDDDDGGGGEKEGDNSLSDDRRRRGEGEKRKSPSSSVYERIPPSPVKIGGVVAGGGPSDGRPRVLALEFQYLAPGGESERSGEIHNGSSGGGKPKFNPKIVSRTHALLTNVDALPPHQPLPIEPSDRYVTLYPDDDKYEYRLKDIQTKSNKYKGNGREPLEDDECKARHEWQKGAYPVCNILHEYELGQLSTMYGRAERRGLRRNEGEGEEIVRHLSNGYWRDVWLLSKASGSFDDDDNDARGGGRSNDNNETSSSSSSRYREEITVLKTLRYEHDFTDRNYERHRKDALASERLSRSPNVVDIFAYCSDSAVFEYGRGGDIDSALWQYDEEEEKYLVRDIPSIEKIDIGVCVCVCCFCLPFCFRIFASLFFPSDC